MTERAAAGNDLFRTIGGAVIVSYPVECIRALEVSALSYFLGDNEQRARASRCLIDLVAEEGAAHPPSDRCMPAFVLAVVALVSMGASDTARLLVRRAAVWVADRYEDGAGLAEFDASPSREVELLFGHPFEGLAVETRRSSLLATALCDLAAYLGEQTFFLDVVNEFLAVEIAFEYFQPNDGDGQFRIDGADVRQYPNVEYGDSIGCFTDFKFGSHVLDEPRSFALADDVGAASYAALMFLLRDRYFPCLWPRLSATKV